MTNNKENQHTKKLSKAFQFHSFNPNHKPNINQSDGLAPAYYDPPDNSLFSDLTSKNFALISLLLLSAWLFKQYFDKNNALFIAPAVVAISAFVALYGALKSVENTRKIAKEDKAISAVNELWTKDTANGTNSFHEAINNFSSLQRKVFAYCKEQDIDPTPHIAVTAARLAVAKESDEFLETNQEIWSQVVETFKLNRDAIRKGFNEAERLCQAMTLKIYDEDLIQDIIGHDISAMVVYLLPYIYTMREVHARRMLKRTNFLEHIPFDADQPHYKAQKETHDLMYEQIEYYAYKWQLTDRPVSFKHFHDRLICVYENLRLAIQQNKAADLPFISFLQHHEKSTFTILETLLKREA